MEPKIDSVKTRILQHIKEYQASLAKNLGNTKIKLLPPLNPVVAKLRLAVENAGNDPTVKQRSALSVIMKPLEKVDHPAHELYCTIEKELLAQVRLEKAIEKACGIETANEDFLAAVKRHPKPQELVDAYAYLKRVRMLTEENRQLLESHPAPQTLAEILVWLKKANLYSIENRIRAATHPLHMELLQSITSLGSGGLLNLWHYELVLKHQQPANVGKALCKLAKRDAYIESYRDLVIEENNPVACAERLIDVHPTVQSFEPLSQDNRALVLNYARNPQSLSSGYQLNFMRGAGILTLTSFLQLIAEENRFLLTGIATRSFWYILPQHRLTAEVWQTVLAIGREPNPLVRLDEYTRNLQGIVQDVLDVRANQAPLVFNGAQSTHFRSVHKSTSESAKRLRDRYQKLLKEKGQRESINAVKAWADETLKEFPYSITVGAAARCIRRITAPAYMFVDDGSQVKLRELIALVWLAILDDTLRIGTLSDAKRQYQLALYEIQRGYNLSDTGVDTGGNDKPICTAGTFNKFIEKLVGIHPDAEQLVLTTTGATLKLPVVVKEKALAYLSSHPECIQKIKEDGLTAIWEAIREPVKKCMFSEYESLFERIDNPNFIQLVENGIWLDIDVSHLKIPEVKLEPEVKFESEDFQFDMTEHNQVADLEDPIWGDFWNT